MNPKFDLPINDQIVRYQTNEEFSFESADQTRKFSQQDLEQITKICNQPLMYEMLFSDLFNGRPYTINDADFFIHKAQSEWSEHQGFVFFIRNTDNEIVAALDIKSANLEEAEVGYWASSEYPGIMTNALKKMVEVAKKAGYKKLWATTKVENKKSQNVLIRAGFTNLGEIERKGKPRRKFELKLN